VKRSRQTAARRPTPAGEAGQPARAIPGYLRSLRRTPRNEFVTRLWTAADLLGPARVVDPAPPRACDLSRLRPAAPRAMGQLIRVTGRVLDQAGRPLRGVLLELWQANAAGKYLHPNDPSPVPTDPHFAGRGRMLTGADGGFELLTIKPGGYAVPYEGEHSASDWWRPPHIHFSLFGPAFASRLVTQMYFPGEPLNRYDLLLNSILDHAARRRLIARFARTASTPDGVLGFRHDFVLGGPSQTPWEERP